MAALPDTLQLMAGSLSAGYSMPQAVDTVVREGKGPISTEFNRALVETRLGVELEDALDGIAERMQSVDFAWVVMAIRIQREVGGNLAEVLTTVSATLRERERLRRQVQVLSAEGRLSAWILGLLPIVFAFYLVLVRPEYLAPLVALCRRLVHHRRWRHPDADRGPVASQSCQGGGLTWHLNSCLCYRARGDLPRHRAPAHHHWRDHVGAPGGQSLACCCSRHGLGARQMKAELDKTFRRTCRLAHNGTTDRHRAPIHCRRSGRSHQAPLGACRQSRQGWDVDRVIAFKVLGTVRWVRPRVFRRVRALAGSCQRSQRRWALHSSGSTCPTCVLYQVGYNRSDQIRKDLPDALDLLTISVEAGLAFDAAVSQVARNTDGPLADEFFRVLQEMQIGMGRTEAMRALGERTDVEELQGFVTAMVQADAFGIPIANVLREFRRKRCGVKRSQRAEEKAQKVPVKILFPLIFCILPCLFIVVLGPAAINIYDAIIVGE